MATSHPVIDGLRTTLARSRSAAAFIEQLEGRLRQLLTDMVDGRVVPAAEATALRASIVELVRSEVLPKLVEQNPNDALRVLDKLGAYRVTELEGERPRIEAARAAMYPTPPPATWPEIAELRAAVERHAGTGAFAMGPPVGSAYFAKELHDDGVALPDEILALYAACDGFELSCVAAPHLPVFSLLESKSIDILDGQDGYRRRVVLFQGQDDVHLSVCRDRTKQWWLVYDYGAAPIAKTAFELRALLRFGLQRMNAASPDALDGELSWERFFGVGQR